MPRAGNASERDWSSLYPLPRDWVELEHLRRRNFDHGQTPEHEVGGLVEHALAFSFAEMLQLSRQDQVIDFHCVEGWSVLDVPCNGIHIDGLMELVRPTSAATQVTFHCFGDVYAESF